MTESPPPLGFHQPRAEVLLLCNVSHMPHSFLTCCSFSLRMLLISSENVAVTVAIAQCAYAPTWPISSLWRLWGCPDPPFLKQFCPPTFLSPFRMYLPLRAPWSLREIGTLLPDIPFTSEYMRKQWWGLGCNWSSSRHIYYHYRYYPIIILIIIMMMRRMLITTIMNQTLWMMFVLYQTALEKIRYILVLCHSLPV